MAIFPRSKDPGIVDVCSRSTVLVRQVLIYDSNFGLVGAPTIVTVFQLPQRFQLVNGISPTQAGIRVIPFSAALPIGGVAASIVTGKFKIPPVYSVLVGAALQIVGFSLLATMPMTTAAIPPRMYGFQVIGGFGSGMNLALLLYLIPPSVDSRDQGT
jgi:hypothetical protein